MLNKNLVELRINEAIEDGILKMVRLESQNDNSFQETSASIKLLNSLIRYMQSLRKNDESIPACIDFMLRMIEILVKNYGVNDSIKQAVQAITHKLVKSLENITTRVLEIEEVNALMNRVCGIIFKDLDREDLTLFLL